MNLSQNDKDAIKALLLVIAFIVGMVIFSKYDCGNVQRCDWGGDFSYGFFNISILLLLTIAMIIGLPIFSKYCRGNGILPLNWNDFKWRNFK